MTWYKHSVERWALPKAIERRLMYSGGTEKRIYRFHKSPGASTDIYAPAAFLFRFRWQELPPKFLSQKIDCARMPVTAKITNPHGLMSRQEASKALFSISTPSPHAALSNKVTSVGETTEAPRLDVDSTDLRKHLA